MSSAKTKPRKFHARLVAYYLSRYLAQDELRRARLAKHYFKSTGEKLPRNTLWRHLRLDTAPPAEIFLVYLNFLFREKAIAADPAGKSLFVYCHPELLKAK